MLLYEPTIGTRVPDRESENRHVLTFLIGGRENKPIYTKSPGKSWLDNIGLTNCPVVEAGNHV
jgi:hypothetical protein